MSIDEQSDSRFESLLGDALSRTSDGFPTDVGPRLDGVLARGRTLRRRRAATVAGSVTALALIGVGGVYATSLTIPPAHSVQVAAAPTADSAPQTHYPTPTEPTTPPPIATVTQNQLLDTLKALLPPGQLGDPIPQGKGGATPSGASAGVVFDDGHGEAALSLSLRRLSPDQMNDGEDVCPNPADIPVDDCKASKLADGSTLVLVQGYEYPDKRVPTKRWWATLTSTDGRRVQFTEFNSSQEKGAEVTRSTPPLGFPELTTLVTAPSWQPLFAGIPQLVQVPSSQIPAQPTGTAILATAARLLPRGLAESSPYGDSTGSASFTVDDGKGAGLVEIYLEDWNALRARSQNPSGLYAGATVLPDGTWLKLAPNGDTGGKGGKGVIRAWADALLPDGTRVEVMAFNSSSPRLDATRATPALTMDQVQAMAVSHEWAALRTGRH